jgi:hypothetical protein
MKMDYRIALFLLTGLPLMPACIQELDTGADRETKANLANPPPPLPEHPSIIDFVAEPPLVTPISTNEPESADDSCAAQERMALDTLDSFCAHCHAPGRGGGEQARFSQILDVGFLTANKPNTKGMVYSQLNYITPGAPKESAIYVRIADGSMPMTPDAPAAEAHNYRFPFTTSDKSLIYTWIKDCLK